MAFDDGDKTEAPTPRRREEARERGQIAKSADLTSALLLLGGMLLMRWLGPSLISWLIAAMRTHLDQSDPVSSLRLDWIPIASSVGLTVLYAAGPLLVSACLLSIASNLLQVGFVFTTTPLEPSLDKLDPVKGFSRVFNMRALFTLAMSLIKLGLVGAVAWSAISSRIPELMLAMQVDSTHLLALMATLCYDVGVRLGLALLILALIDYFYQRWKHERDLRMTREQVKEEMRRMEGDPIIRQRRRRMQLAAAMQQIRKMVPQADVIVTNPTELAIALKYDAKSMSAPRVIAKGADYLAQKIREIAALHGVPIIERKPLAQALYKMVEVGHEVPEQFYKAIAEILAYVYELSGKAPRRRPANAA
jgi:flagellar biosynthetic protein FlhB